MKILLKKPLTDTVINRGFQKDNTFLDELWNNFIMYLSTLNYIFTGKFQLKIINKY